MSECMLQGRNDRSKNNPFTATIVVDTSEIVRKITTSRRHRTSPPPRTARIGPADEVLERGLKLRSGFGREPRERRAGLATAGWASAVPSDQHGERQMTTTRLTLGTAHLIRTGTTFELRYMNVGSFLIGEQTFGNVNSALRFCRERGLRVIETVGF